MSYLTKVLGVAQVDLDEVVKLQKEVERVQKKLRALGKAAGNYINAQKHFLPIDTNLNYISIELSKVEREFEHGLRTKVNT